MYRFIIVLLMTILLGCASAQTKHRINIDYYKVEFVPQKCQDTLIRESGRGYVKVFLKSCRGAMDIEFYSNDSALIEKGSFNSSKLYKKNARGVGAAGSSKTERIYFYSPVKDGVWFYYENGKIARKEKYVAGVLVAGVLD